MTSGQARKRKEHGKAAHQNGASSNPSKVQTVEDIAMDLPNRTRPDGKTLFELAEERQAELDKQNGRPPRVKKEQWKDKYGEHSEEDFLGGDPLGPFGDAVLYGSSLSMMHFTLDVLVHNQYRQEIVWKEIWWRLGTVVPVLMLLVYMLHPTPKSRYLAIAKQLFFFAAAIAAGCHMMYAANKFGYYAVMKRAPAFGTLWIWSVIEMELPYGVPSIAVVAIYSWWNGLQAF